MMPRTRSGDETAREMRSSAFPGAPRAWLKLLLTYVVGVLVMIAAALIGNTGDTFDAISNGVATAIVALVLALACSLVARLILAQSAGRRATSLSTRLGIVGIRQRADREGTVRWVFCDWLLFVQTDWPTLTAITVSRLGRAFHRSGGCRMAQSLTREIPLLFVLSTLGFGCTTSDVAWDETQYSKAQSVKQMVTYLEYPLERKIALAKLGSPAVRHAESAQITTLIPREDVESLIVDLAANSKYPPKESDEFLAALRDRMLRSRVTVEILGYQTGPKEITRIWLFQGRAFGTDVIYLPELIYAEQGPWITRRADEEVKLGMTIEAVSSVLGSPATCSPPPEDQNSTVCVYSAESQATVVRAGRDRVVLQIQALRWESGRQANGRADVALATLAAVGSQKPPDSLLEKWLTSTPGDGGQNAMQGLFGNELLDDLTRAVEVLGSDSAKAVRIISGVSEPPPAAAPTFVTPQASHGPWNQLRLGMSGSDVTAILGNPTTSKGWAGGLMLDSPSGKFRAVEVFYYPSGMVGLGADAKVSGWVVY